MKEKLETVLNELDARRQELENAKNEKERRIEDVERVMVIIRCYLSNSELDVLVDNVDEVIATLRKNYHLITKE